MNLPPEYEKDVFVREPMSDEEPKIMSVFKVDEIEEEIIEPEAD